jgi:acyl-homoserine lactone acylase PvdQ
MTNEMREKQLDDQLADFTDRVLSDTSEANVQEANQNELAELQKTVLRLKSAAQTARADSKANARIRSRLMVEWKKDQQAKRAADKGFNWNWNMPRLALAGGFVVLVLVGVVTLLPPSSTPLTATAGGLRAWSPFLVLAGIIVIVIIFWHNSRD